MKTHSFTVKTLGTVLLLSTAVIGGSTARGTFYEPTSTH